MPRDQKIVTVRVILAACMLVLAGGCSSPNTPVMQDGYYTAEAADYDLQGWKEFITIYVNGDKIVTAEYNAKNLSGFVRSWDMDKMRRMNAETGTYPNKYARAYTVALLNRQSPTQINALPGASKPLKSFQILAEAAINQARKGDKTVAFVEIPDYLTAADSSGYNR